MATRLRGQFVLGRIADRFVITAPPSEWNLLLDKAIPSVVFVGRPPRRLLRRVGEIPHCTLCVEFFFFFAMFVIDNVLREKKRIKRLTIVQW